LSFEPWKVSLHGGHSGDFSEHGQDTLRELLEAAVAFGYSTFGVTAHAPVDDSRFLYEEEIAARLSADDLFNNFRSYNDVCTRLTTEFEDRLEVLRGAEVEVVPESNFADQASKIRDEFDLDYLVGSVHWVDEMPIDTSRADFERAVESCGGLEPLLLRYYEHVGQMIESVNPEIIGHLDLPRLYSEGSPELSSNRVMSAVGEILERANAAGTIIDLNVSAFSKGLQAPYPAPWIVNLASDIGVPFCFGDDSHSAAAVGVGIEAGRDYLLTHGIESITKLTRVRGVIEKQIVPLR
jgi:histidinol-phosphatase (PHP family)